MPSAPDQELSVDAIHEMLFKKFMTTLPQGFESTFRLTNAIVYLPSDEGGSELSIDPERPYELTLSTGAFGTPDMYTTRDSLNAFMDRVAAAAVAFQDSLPKLA